MDTHRGGWLWGNLHLVEFWGCVGLLSRSGRGRRYGGLEGAGHWTEWRQSRTGVQSQLCIPDFPRSQRLVAKSALLELDGEEGDMGWIGMWTSCTFRDGIGVMSQRTKQRGEGGRQRTDRQCPIWLWWNYGLKKVHSIEKWIMGQGYPLLTLTPLAPTRQPCLWRESWEALSSLSSGTTTLADRWRTTEQRGRKEKWILVQKSSHVTNVNCLFGRKCKSKSDNNFDKLISS